MPRPESYRVQDGCHNCTHCACGYLAHPLNTMLGCELSVDNAVTIEDLCVVVSAGKCDEWEKSDEP